jgi:hypothetical protein
VRSALEQRLVKLCLKLRYLHAQRRLHNVEPLRRTRDRAVFEQRDEIVNLLQVHERQRVIA